MRVIYPFVTRFSEALAALEGWPVEEIDVSSDGEGYYRLWADLWASGDTFVVIEQDIVAPPGMLQSFEDCPEEWCAAIYWMPWGGFGAWFGAVRFRGSLTRRHPSLPDEIGERHWSALDSAFINHLRLHGYSEAHRHGSARHLTKGRPGLNETLFIGCAECGVPLPTEEVIASPYPKCAACGAVNNMAVSPVTVTSPVL